MAEQSAITRQTVASNEALQVPLILAENIMVAVKAAEKFIETTKANKGKIMDTESISEAQKAVKTLTDEQKQLVAINKQIATTEAKNNQAYIEKAAKLSAVKKELKDKIALGERDSLTVNKQNSSITQLGAALKKNQAAWSALSTAEQRASKEGQALLKVIQQQDVEYKELRKEQGIHVDEVGNYTLATKNLKAELKAAKGEMLAIADTLGTSSPQYQAAAKRAGELSDKLSDANDEAKAFAGDTALQNLGTRFGLLADKAKNLDFKGVGEQLKAIFKLIIANPLLLIIGGVILLTTTLYKLRDSIPFVAQAFKFLGDTADFLIGKLKAFTDAIGLTTFADDEATRRAVENGKTRRKNAEITGDFLIAIAEAQGKETVDLEIKKNRDIIKANRMTIAELQKLGDKRSDDENKLLDELIEANVKMGMEIFILEQTRTANAKKSAADRLKAEKDALFELQKFRLENAIKERELIINNDKETLAKREEANKEAGRLRIQLVNLIVSHELSAEGLLDDEKTLIRERGNAARLESDRKTMAEREVLFDAEREAFAKSFDDVAKDSAKSYDERVHAARLAGIVRLQSEEQIAAAIKAINDELLNDLKKNQQEENDIVATNLANELALLDQAYLDGELKLRDYNRERNNLQEEYSDSQLNQMVAQLEEEKALRQQFGQDITGIDKAIAEARGAIAAESAAERKAYEEEFNKALINLTNETIATASALYLGNSEAKIQNLELQLDKEQEAAERSLAIVGNDAQAKAFIQEELARKQAAIDKQIAAEKRKQYIFNRGVEAAEIIANTASGIVKAVSASPLTFGLPWSAFVGATGALQLARLFATPIPQFAEGVENFKGGWAITGEEGTEAKISRQGKITFTKPHANLEYVDPGTTIVPHDKTMQMLAMAGLSRGDIDGGSQYNFKRIESKLDEVGTKIQKAVGKTSQDVYDERGYRRYERKENNRVLRLDRRYKLG